LHGVGEDPVVVERERMCVTDWHPLRRRRVVLPDRNSSSTRHEEDHTGRGLTWVTVGSGIDSDETYWPRHESRLLPEFAHDSLLYGLPILHESSRQCEDSPERGPATSHEENSI
jgi:hypothetical protein